MKKVFGVMLSVVMLLSMSVTAFAVESYNTPAYSEVSLGEIQEMFVSYLDDAGLSFEPGTTDYYEYIVEQLLDHTDTNLRNNENYDLIHAYMAEYKVNYEDYLLCQAILTDDNEVNPVIDDITRSNDCISADSDTGIVQFSITESFLNKTIADIIEENENRYDAAPNNARSAKLSGYSASDAANYAVKWGRRSEFCLSKL